MKECSYIHTQDRSNQVASRHCLENAAVLPFVQGSGQVIGCFDDLEMRICPDDFDDHLRQQWPRANLYAYIGYEH